MKHLVFAVLGIIALAGFSMRANALSAGTMDYNTTAGRMSFYDGTQWYYFAAGLPGGACTSAGTMDFDTLLTSYKVCNGSQWTYVGGVVTLSVCSVPGQMDYNGSTFLVCNGLLWVNIKGLVVTS